MINLPSKVVFNKEITLQVTYPDYYTNACCSHPLYIDGKAEDIITAAKRRMNYELGIPLDKVIVFLPSLT